MAIQPNSRIGPYRIHRPIGQGGFSTVYLASDDRLDSNVAIKVLADNWALDPDVRSRFLSEGQQLRAAANPHLIAIHDIGETDTGQPYLVLQYAERRTLADRLTDALEAAIAPTERDIERVVDALSGAVGPLHRIGVIHRDITPANLLITAGTNAAPWSGKTLLDDAEELVLADLGLAKDLTAASGVTAGAGTTNFQAPEQLATPSTVDVRTDIYAASAVVATIVTGKTDPDERRAGLDLGRSIHAGLHAGLDPDPQRRPVDLDDWHDRLQVPVPSAVASFAGPVRRRRTPLAIAAVLLIAAAIAVTAIARVSDDDGLRRETISNGLITSTRTVDGVSITIIAPRSLEIGRTVQATATSTADDAPLFWLTPDGRYLDADAPLDLTPRSPGIFKITLVSLLADGTIVRVDHTATAVTERILDD